MKKAVAKITAAAMEEEASAVDATAEQDDDAVQWMVGDHREEGLEDDREEKERDDIFLYRMVSSPYAPKLGKHFRPYPSQNQIFYFLQEGAKGLQRSRRGEEEI